MELIKELFVTIGDLVRGRGLRLNERPVRKLGVMIVVASIPTAVIGILFEDIFEGFYTTLLPTGCGLLITGMLHIKLDKRPEAAPLVIERHQVKLIKDAQIKLERSEIEALKGIE